MCAHVYPVQQQLEMVYMTLAALQLAGVPGNHELFTKASLAQYNGIESKLLYMAILGNVFDVSEKAEFYGKQHPGSFHLLKLSCFCTFQIDDKAAAELLSLQKILLVA